MNTNFGSPRYFGKSVAHGVVGGAFSEVAGGGFKSGFLAAGFSSFSGNFEFTSDYSNIVYRSVVGGVGSVLGGGKFADGALTGAFTYLFNDCAHRACFENHKSDGTSIVGEFTIDPDTFGIGVGVKTDEFTPGGNVYVDVRSSAPYIDETEVENSNGRNNRGRGNYKGKNSSKSRSPAFGPPTVDARAYQKSCYGCSFKLVDSAIARTPSDYATTTLRVTPGRTTTVTIFATQTTVPGTDVRVRF